MLNDLFGGIVDDFMEKTDDMINKLEKNKSMLSADEKEPVVMMGGKIDHTFEMNDEERRKYEEVGRKIDALTKEIESERW